MDKRTNSIKEIKKCVCGKEFSVSPSRLRLKFCSQNCYWKHGIDTKGEKNGRWVGDKIGKAGVHDWIEREKGKAKYLYCSKYDDGTCKGRIEWSNVSQKYLRKIDDWQILCGSHHRRYDSHTYINGIKTRFIKGHIPWNKKK